MVNKSVFLSLLVIGVVATAAGAGTWACFYDAEFVAPTLTAGTLDLKVNGGNYDCCDPFEVEVGDLKPGYEWEVVKKLELNSNPADVWVGMPLCSMRCDTGVLTEPEENYENWCGVNDQICEVISYSIDVVVDRNGDGELNNWERQYGWNVVLDEDLCPFECNYLGVLPADKTVFVIQSFRMDECVGNWAQGDTCTFKEIFVAMQVDQERLGDVGIPENGFRSLEATTTTPAEVQDIIEEEYKRSAPAPAADEIV